MSPEVADCRKKTRVQGNIKVNTLRLAAVVSLMLTKRTLCVGRYLQAFSVYNNLFVCTATYLRCLTCCYRCYRCYCINCLLIPWSPALTCSNVFVICNSTWPDHVFILFISQFSLRKCDRCHLMLIWFFLRLWNMLLSLPHWGFLVVMEKTQISAVLLCYVSFSFNMAAFRVFFEMTVKTSSWIIQVISI